MQSTADRHVGQPAALVSIGSDAVPITLAALAEQINDHHQQVGIAFQSGLDHAREAGRLLIEAKSQLAHGGWAPWVQQNFHGSSRTARAYVQVAHRWPELEANRQPVATFKEALRLLAEPKPESPQADGHRPKPFSEIPLESRRKLCTEWWDILASYTLVHDAAGESVAQIAELCGMPQEDVGLILNPRPPNRFGSEINGSTTLFGAAVPLYQDAVMESVLQMLGNRYFAIEYVAENEHLDEVIPDLQAAGRQTRRRCRQLAGSTRRIAEAWAGTAAKRDGTISQALYAAMMMCVWEDARIALGIPADRRKRPEPFVMMLAEYERAATKCLEDGDQESQP